MWANSGTLTSSYLHSSTQYGPPTNNIVETLPYFQLQQYVRMPPPKIYLCPSDPSGPSSNGLMQNTDYGNGYQNIGTLYTNYVVNSQVCGKNSPKVPSSFPDGAATTAMFFERYGRSTAWGNRVPNPWDTGVDQNRAIAH